MNLIIETYLLIIIQAINFYSVNEENLFLKLLQCSFES